MMRPLLTVKDLCAGYGKKAVLRDLSFALYEREVVGLIGLNGAGKTTLINTLSGLHETYQANAIHWCEQAISLRDRSFKRQRYTIFAEDDAFGYFTFGEYFAYVAKAYGKTPNDVESLVQGFHFADYTGVLMRELSTGNRKKAFLITAFALRPPLLLLDEPVNGLNLESTEFLYQLIKGYKAYGTVLFASHILESLTLTADRVLVLANGHITQNFAVDALTPSAIREALHHDVV